MSEAVLDWLPAGKRAALCFSIDDVHPAKSSDYYEAGGDLGRGVLGRLRWLLDRHPQLRVTLFVTADWREISPVPTRRLLASIPRVRDHVYLAKRWPKGAMRLDRHPEFVAYLEQLPRTEVGLHGLHHCSKGLRIPVEFQDQTREESRAAVRELIGIFERAGLDCVPGMCPPGWSAPPALLDALHEAGVTWIAASRDIFTPISPDAKSNMSGFTGVSLLHPQRIDDGRFLHFPANFNPTCPIERATSIIECGGLLSIKAHAVKSALGFVAYDGLDEIYANYLDVLLTTLGDRYGDDLWWTSMGEIAERALGSEGTVRPLLSRAG
jgi:hypothetical protein